MTPLCEPNTVLGSPTHCGMHPGPLPPVSPAVGPPPRAVGHTFEFSFPIPKPANAGNSTRNQKKTARKSTRENPEAKNTTKAAPNRRTEPDPSLAEDRKRKRAEYERARSQTPERMEYRRLLAQEKRQRAKELGKCRTCSNQATPSQTRCPTCAEKHRQSRRRNDAERRESAPRANHRPDQQDPTPPPENGPTQPPRVGHSPPANTGAPGTNDNTTQSPSPAQHQRTLTAPHQA